MTSERTKQLREGARQVRSRAREGVRARVEVASRRPRGLVCTGLLVLGYAGFLLVGVAVFAAVEAPEEVRSRDLVQQHLAVFLRNNSCVNMDELLNIAAAITMAQKAGIHVATSPGRESINWNPEGAFFFVGTTVSTIGYGNLAPATVTGKVFCTIFATFGIPLNLVVLNKAGQATLHGVELIAGALRKRGLKECQVRLLSGGLFLGVGFALFLLIPSAVFMTVEGWGYAESYYFSFITLSTIGFGDYVVGRNETVQYPAFYKTLVAAWFFFGLAWLSALFSAITGALERAVSETGRAEPERPRGGGGEGAAGCPAARPPGARPPLPQREGGGRRRRSEFELFVIHTFDARSEIPLMVVGKGT
ncbi:potassium channel subfamily K member 16-like [Lethenteron reissneri]|uniref:potassium channel subfamily K member 16-like n=1 Tax=Lethenteron reissneri TaxID=7753 RepID=UPI002AB6273B|nr:potassium channel subfamily K member 16-like [Lethenteron reissneri]